MNNFMRSFFGNFQNRRRRNSNARPNGVRQDQAAFMNNFVNNLFEAQQNEEPQGPPPTDPRVLRELKECCLNLEDINNGNKTCSICFEEQHVGDLASRLPCGHCFHKSCVWPWLQKHCTCPVCRYEVVTKNMNYNNMSNKERSDRQRIQAQREMKKRQHESELRRKRDRLTMMESSEKKFKPEAKPAPSDVEPCNPFDVYEGISTEQSSTTNSNVNDAGNVGTGNPFDVYDQDASIGKPTSTESPVESNGEVCSDYSNNHYVGRDDDPVWAIVTSLSIRQLKKVLQCIGLDSSTCIDKRDLIEMLSNACYQPYLMKLSVRELRRRLRHMKLSASDVVDKSVIVNRIKDGVFDIISMQTFGD